MPTSTGFLSSNVHGGANGSGVMRAFTIIDVLSIKIIDGKFAGRESVGRGSGRRIVRRQSRHPAAKVLRFGADPEGNWKKRGRRCGQPPPALRSRPLGRRSGCSSAEPYPPPSASSAVGSGPWTRTVPFPLNSPKEQSLGRRGSFWPRSVGTGVKWLPARWIRVAMA